VTNDTASTTTTSWLHGNCKTPAANVY